MTVLLSSISQDWVLWRKTPVSSQGDTQHGGVPQRYIGDAKYHGFPLADGTPFTWMTSGANGSDVWGTNNGKVYRLKAKASEAVPMDRISAAADGTVWGIRERVPHRLTNGQWQAMPGRMSWIACGAALEVWALDDSWSTGGRPFRWTGSAWEQRGDLRMLSISASSDRKVIVATTHDGRVVRWTPGPVGTWTEISRTPFLQIVSVNNHTMYASDLANVYRWNGHSWAHAYGADDGGWVSLADDGTVVVTDARRRVWRSSGIAGFVELPMPPSISACAANANSVWSWNADQKGSHHWPGEDWELVPSPAGMYTLSAGVDGTVWGTDFDRHIHRYHPADGTWELMPGTAFTYVSVGSAAHVIVLDRHEVRRWNVTTHAWDTLPIVPLQAQAAAIGGDGTLLGSGSLVTTHGIEWHVYRYEDATRWTLIPDLHLVWMKVCSANLIIGDIEDYEGEDLLWIGKLPSAATGEAAEECEPAHPNHRAYANALAFFGEEGIAGVIE